ncbi:MAG: hypothetical protein KGJ32_12935 [Xanthomonadaceae bacterium]|nr:hypothetical protein [Xanthomonadaceae bacterium]
MNIKRALLLPWQVAHVAVRWLALALFGAAVVGATAFGIFSHQPDMWVRTAGVIGVAEALIGSSCLMNPVLLAIDAHQLRMPGIERQAMAGVLLNGVLGSFAPAVVIGWFSGHVLVLAVFVALFCVGGFLWSLLPRYAGLVLYLAALKATMFTSWVPGPGKAHFLAWALPALVLGLVLVAVCWRRWVLAPNPYRMSRRSPPVLRLGLGAAVAGRGPHSQLNRRHPWLQARADLRGCGPRHPVRSLRVALGGSYQPLTTMGWLRQSVLVIAAVAMLVAWIAVMILQGEAARTFSGILHSDAMTFLVAGGVCVSIIYASSCLGHLRLRWSCVNAELPLLALLPGLGTGVKRDLLRASLWPPLRILLLAALLALALVTRLSGRAEVFALLAPISAAGYLVAFTLLIFSGQRPGRWTMLGLNSLGLLLFGGGLFALPFSSTGGASALSVVLLWGLFLIAWLALAAILLWSARLGWRGLQRRPHPFLSN